MAGQSGSDDDAVGRVAMNALQSAGAGSDDAINRDFAETAVQQFLTPLVGGHIAGKAVFLQQHSDFPNGDGGKGNCAIRDGHSDVTSGLDADAAVSGDQTDADVGVQNRHRFSSSISFQVLNHSDGIGDTMSPRISTSM